MDFRSLPEIGLADLLRHARAVDASDLHLAVNAIPHLRVHGEMTPLPLAPSTEEATERMIFPILSDAQRAKLIAESEHRLLLQGGRARPVSYEHSSSSARASMRCFA